VGRRAGGATCGAASSVDDKRPAAALNVPLCRARRTSKRPNDSRNERGAQTGVIFSRWRAKTSFGAQALALL